MSWEPKIIEKTVNVREPSSDQAIIFISNFEWPYKFKRKILDNWKEYHATRYELRQQNVSELIISKYYYLIREDAL